MTGFIDPLDPEPTVEVEHPGTLPDDSTAGTADLGQVRELVLRAYPDVVPELVIGDSITTLLASVGPASDAYTALRERIAAPAPPVIIPHVPAGAIDPVPLDPDRLPIAEKLRRGIVERARQHAR